MPKISAMTNTKHGSASGVGVVLGAAVLWGTVGPAQVLADTPMGPAALGGWRLMIGGLVLTALVARSASRIRPLLKRRAWWPLLVCTLSTGLFQVAFLSSVERTGAALATIVALGTAPALTGLIARWATGERVGAAWVVSTTAAIAGCALLLAPGSGRADGVGLLLGVASGAFYGLYTVFAKRLVLDDPAVHLPTVSAVSLTAGAVMLLPWTLTDTAGLRDAGTLGLIAWLGLAATVAAYWLFSTGLTRVSATAVGTLSLAEPLAAALLGVLVLGEVLSPVALAGSALLLGGLAAVCLPPRRDAGTETAARISTTT